MLARILPIVYTVEIKEGASKHEELKQIEQKLSDWELDLPEVLNPIKSESSPRENGSSGLWFLYLILKLLVCRLELKVRLALKYWSSISDWSTGNQAKRQWLSAGNSGLSRVDS